MTVRVSCPNPECRAVASVEEQSLGRRGRCRKCGHVFALARPAGGPASGNSGDASAWKGHSAPARPPELPERFGRYRILRPLGQGGMGAVYLALDTKLDRRVALKVPHFGPGEGPGAARRFGREARAAATLDHPNLCPVFDVGEVGGTHYFTMPYVEGRPLSELLARSRVVPGAQAATLVRKVALAVGEAHERGVVHRDLKPGNIMINRRREPIVMDFGLARVVDDDERPITRDGHALGTALYMAPEQAGGHPVAVGPASDVYSLGVILHEMVAGVRPFEGPWSLVIGLKNVKDPDPPSSHRPEVGPVLDAICLKALARDPRERFASMAEFAAALDDYLAGPAAPAPAPTVEGPDEVFAGLVTRVDESLREARAEPRRRSSRPRALGLASAAFGVLLLGIFYVATDRGRIRIEVHGPDVVVKVDGQVVRVEGLGEPITLRAGEHELAIARGDLEVRSRRFVVHRGENPPLVVEFEPKAVVDPPTPPPAPPSREPASVAGGRWRVEGGDLVQDDPDSSPAVLLFGDARWTDYDFTVDAMRTAGTDSFSLYVRAGEPERAYAFVVSGRSGSRIYAENYTGGPTRFPSYLPLTLQDDRWYTARVSVRGGRIRCVAEDGPKALALPIFVDEAHPAGRVGLRTWGSAYRFRNIKVTAPDGTALWEGPPAIAPTGPAVADRLQPGSIWAGERTYPADIYKGVTVTYWLHVRERTGGKFVGHVFDNGQGRNYIELEGEVAGDAITWRERLPDGRVIWTIRGTLAGDSIRLKLVAVYEKELPVPGVGALTRE